MIKKTFVLTVLLSHPFVFACASGNVQTISKQTSMRSNVETSSKQVSTVRSKDMHEEFVKISTEIEKVKKNIIKCSSDMKTIEAQIKSLTGKTEQAKKDLKQCLFEIKTARLNLEKSFKMHNSSFSKSSDLNQVILQQWRDLWKTIFKFSYEQNPFEYKIRFKSLEQKTLILRKAKRNISASASDIQKWKEVEKKLLELQQCKNKHIAHLENMLDKKKKLLKIMVDKKCEIEKEMKVLNNNAKTIQMLINKIIETSKQEQITTAKSKHEKMDGSFSWPVNGKVIARFGKIRHVELDAYIISNGIKISADGSNQVKCVGPGEVVFAGQFHSYGSVIIIAHSNSIFSIYGLLDRLFVKENQKVLKGDVIADLGKKKNSTLYFEIRQNSVPVDPILWLKPTQG
ncbi:MAG: peptidoglycan DD-metalloendopeptidase family protein [Endomicrobium sp.]|jgi:septal ring factor EnvC (AmiA/AmiB activator)|nr:peptidoglycan DD-metalloendopeptidase family protein [Endomicrobium sp.]